MNSTRTPRRIATPGAIALAATGLTQRELAEGLDVCVPSVSMYLSGRTGTPVRMPTVLAELIGAEPAERVLAAIPQHKPAGADVAPS